MIKKILTVIGILFFLHSTLYAETIEANYKVEFGIIGQIGIAKAKLTKRDNNSYEIDVELEATGFAKVLSGHRKENHISKGHMENGLLVSDLYQVIKSHGSKMTDKVYFVDHKNKTVRKEYRYWENGKLKEDSNETLDFYSADDLLTLYFNLDKKIGDKTKSESYTFSAVGAEKQGGSVEVVIPTQSNLKEYEEMLGQTDTSWYARAIIHQKIFSSDKGELLLRIGEDGITQKAVLKDLIFFGDIRAERF